MGLGSHLANASAALTGRSAKAEDRVPEGAAEEDTEVLDEKEGNLILSLISQLRPGMELSKIAFPAFVLEPRSMLERVTDFMAHPDLLFGVSQLNDPQERFIRVINYFLSGWAERPKGVKKPYNPVLGEIFRCKYKYSDGSEGFYVAEQVSHHPPISAYYYLSPANNVAIIGELRPQSKFLGNSVMTDMGGESRINLLDTEDGDYVISMPNMYARGILFGKMVLELGDVSRARNAKHGFECDVDFKVKGFFSGTYNAIAGKAKDKSGNTFGEFGGKWSDQIEYKGARTSQSEVLFDAHKSKPIAKVVAPEDEQEPLESRRLWLEVTKAIKSKDMTRAAEAKAEIEDAQRKRREETGSKIPEGRYFRLVKDGSGEHYEPRFERLTDRDAAIKAVQEWIWPGSAAAAAPAPAETAPEPIPAATATEDAPAAAPTAAPASTESEASATIDGHKPGALVQEAAIAHSASP